MTIHEPSTLLTDYLLAGLAGWLAWRLSAGVRAIVPATRWWSRTLALTAVSAFVGGSYHGFGPNFPAGVAGTWWTAVLLIISLVSATLSMGLVHELVAPARQRPWVGLIAVKLAAFAGIALVHPVFLVAIADYGLTLIAWAIAALRVRRAWSNWMLGAIALSMIAAVAQQLHWSIAPQFNHNDLYHVIQALALVGFYRAAGKFSVPDPGH